MRAIAPDTTSSGNRVILALFGGVVLFAAAVLAGFTFLTPEKTPCASGAAVLNPTVQPGISRPVDQTFSHIEEAEAFVCRGLPQAHSPDLKVERITGFRSSSLQDVVEGNAFATVGITYKHLPSGKEVLLSMATAEAPPQLQAPSPTISLGEVEETWVQDGLYMRIRTFDTGLTREQVSAIKASVK